ncbi:hypothetical protein EAF00_003242 [Botryotinia globosa]|nr:hypothetical protein EAF00_003242 [Botryotinia globosa]
MRDELSSGVGVQVNHDEDGRGDWTDWRNNSYRPCQSSLFPPRTSRGGLADYHLMRLVAWPTDAEIRSRGQTKSLRRRSSAQPGNLGDYQRKMVIERPDYIFD